MDVIHSGVHFALVADDRFSTDVARAPLDDPARTRAGRAPAYFRVAAPVVLSNFPSAVETGVRFRADMVLEDVPKAGIAKAGLAADVAHSRHGAAFFTGSFSRAQDIRPGCGFWRVRRFPAGQEKREQEGDHGPFHSGVPRCSKSRSRTASSFSAVPASRFNRRRGSVFEGRKLNHQSG